MNNEHIEPINITYSIDSIRHYLNYVYDLSMSPILIVNVIVNEEHHYHKGAIHDDKSTHIIVNQP